MVYSRLDPMTSFKVVLDYCRYSGLMIEGIDQATKEVTLGQNSTLSHNGFWILIRVQDQYPMGSLVHLGVRSKTVQLMGLRTHLDQVAGGVQAALTAAELSIPSSTVR